MRSVVIDMARGADQSVDPRVAPQGTIANVVNMRVDRAGRLVPRKGYTSLGVTTSNGGGSLVPFDLYTYGKDLVCAGHNALGVQTGIRALYRYSNQAGVVWRTEHDTSSASVNAASMIAQPAADELSILLSEIAAGQSDTVTADCAALSDGTAVCLVSSQEAATSNRVAVTVVSPVTGRVIKSESLATSIAASSARVLAIGTTFYVFYQSGTTVEVRTYTSTTQGALSAATVIATGTSAAPLAYDVANYEGTTDYLLAFATATGYTWRRFSSTHVQQTTTNVAALAGAPLSICGSTGEDISVFSVRAVSGADLRTFTAATGVLAVGPTNIDSSGDVMVWVGLCRFSATQVYCTMQSIAPIPKTYRNLVTIAAHVNTTRGRSDYTRAAGKPLMVDSQVFQWGSLGNASPAPYGLISLQTNNFGETDCLSAVALNGAAKVTYSAATASALSQISKGSGTNYYSALVSFDPRDKTYRANLLGFGLHSGKRRQGVVNGDSLVIAGGVTHRYDGRVSTELGFDVAPSITAAAQSTATGLLTLLGTYQYQVVLRYVASNGDVTESSPSAPRTITLAGASNTVSLAATNTYSIRNCRVITRQGGRVYLDWYRTEAGGSIPRHVASIDASVVAGLGAVVNYVDEVSDAVQQSGALLYTQGADGSISGRLPLGLASPCRYVAAADGKVLLGGLERSTQAHLSIEGRPGEAIGFVNDDLFFVQNPEPITAVYLADGGRRLIFSATNIREIVGAGPNAAGVGDVSEPVEVEPRVGCVDWRSLAKTEHGVFFQASTAPSRIYLLPDGGGSAVDASEGIRHLLELFPVITSATRHEAEQLLTFTLQDTAGTDGRVVHLDLKTSGMGRAGWTGRWIIDRVAALEGESQIEIVEESRLTLPFVAAGFVSFPLPRGKRVGDRMVAAIAAQGATQAFSVVISDAAWTTVLSQASAAGRLQVSERIVTVASSTNNVGSFTISNASAVVIKTWLLRGAHGSQAAEATTLVSASGTSHVLPTLTPTWGTAKTLWLSVAMSDLSFSPFAGSGGGRSNPIWRVLPASFERGDYLQTNAPGNADATIDMATASRQLQGTQIAAATWTSGSSTQAALALVAIRPLAATGTPCRASAQYSDRLVVCNATDVLTVSATSTADLGSTVITQEWESADIFPMGTGGEGRHLSVTMLCELLGICDVQCLVSYDGGRNWTSLRSYQLHPRSGFEVGSTMQLTWWPRRRKIQRVRVKFLVGDTVALGAANGPSAGLAMYSCQLYFEDLVGPGRVLAQQRGSVSI